MILFLTCGSEQKSNIKDTIDGIQIQYVDVEGGKLSYIIKGNGKPIIVLGTFIMDSKTYSEELKDKFELIFLNMRHFDKDNNLKTNEITLQTYLNDIEYLRKKLGYDKVAILGHSAHGLLAIEYAKSYPYNTSHLILIGTPPYFSQSFNLEKEKFWNANASNERKEKYQQKWNREKRRITNWFLPDDKKFKIKMVARSPQRWYDLDFDPTYLWKGVEINSEVMNHFIGNVTMDYLLPDSIKTPTFIAHGKYDFAIPYTTWTEQRKSKFINLSFNLFDMSSHFPHMEQQELFDKKLIEWIEN
ncbi:MAG: alpha/beta hydrolase [Clostridiales bacterium]|nr:alpha/beta hydrolase [Clostridiales bacterium]